MSDDQISPAEDTEFPVPLPRFLASLKGTHDEVWTRLLQVNHGTHKNTVAGWKALLETHKRTKVS